MVTQQKHAPKVGKPSIPNSWQGVKSPMAGIPDSLEGQMFILIDQGNISSISKGKGIQSSSRERIPMVCNENLPHICTREISPTIKKGRVPMMGWQYIPNSNGRENTSGPQTANPHWSPGAISPIVCKEHIPSGQQGGLSPTVGNRKHLHRSAKGEYA